MQSNGAGHDDACHKQAQLAVLAGVVLVQVVTVDQLVQIVRCLGVIFIDVRNFRVGFLVDQVIQKVGHCHTDGNGCHHGPHTHVGFNCFGHQVKADHTDHDAAGKAQQQADRPVGIFLQHGTDEATQSGSGHTCQRGSQN